MLSGEKSKILRCAQNDSMLWYLGGISEKLKNDAAADDIRQIQEWLDQLPENSLILDEIVNTWSITKGKSKLYQPDLPITGIN